MKSICLLFLLLFASCRESGEVLPEGDTSDSEQIIVHAEYSGEEPTKPEETEIFEPVPPVVRPFGNNGIPDDAVVLFDGSNLDKWISAVDSTAANWYLNKNGSMTVRDKTGDIQTKQNFGSIQLHLEWKSPEEVRQDGQNRANSGVFLNGLYEIQVLDNNDNATYVNGQVGSIYKQHVPLVKASVATGEWNTYDIIYHAPDFNPNGQKIKSGTVTLLHNGILVLDDVELKGTTSYIGWPKNPPHGKGPLKLQDHRDNSRVSYRNIWLREL